ncbi:hypothetical protein NADFUDRAFT_46663 [Nadsonia fulvescens var. elongata DSM 6958]|uniref:Mannosyl phosphorylinositol ceramide synthase SUR1 n=1 Tax=Nadsonia fulvescens var. elongata DSM 6958 TaxID=857566 RepID=A0A1E3PLR7_9ASCO|nr:hypothetical protein NADFUDRAFT_46663 [Nadsonia fulvescens var. elongata DSM 6958]
MKKELKALLIVNGIFVFIAICYLFDLITLLYDDSSRYAITSLEIDAALSNSSTIPGQSGDNNKQTPQPLIPKIIHQTYKTDIIPEDWLVAQKSCKNLHPDYEYRLWTDETSRQFIKEHYDWFLETFDNYPMPIMRADAIRYFVLYHFGGIYIDLDDGCQRSLDPLLQFRAFLRKTDPTGISNDVMGSVPHHPFFKKTIDSLKKYNHSWLIPYVTIMYSTGPLFLSVILKQYNRWGNPIADQVKVLVKPFYKGNADKSFFFYAPGSSWHLGDAKFIFSMGKHWFLAALFGTALVLGFFYLQYLAFARLLNSKYFKLYKRTIGRGIRNRLVRFRLLRRLVNLLGISLTESKKNEFNGAFGDIDSGLLADYDNDNFNIDDDYEMEDDFTDKPIRNRDMIV